MGLSSVFFGVLCLLGSCVVFVFVFSICVNDSLLDVLVSTFLTLDLVAIAVFFMVVLCDCYGYTEVLGNAVEYTCIDRYTEGTNEEGSAIAMFRDLGDGEYKSLLLDVTEKMSNTPVLLVKYEVIRYHGTSIFYYSSSKNGTKYVLE